MRYYISQKALKHGYDACPIKSASARHLDDLVRAIVLDHLGAAGIDLRPIEPAARDQRLRDVLRLVTVGPDRLTVDLDEAAVERLCGGLDDLRTAHAGPPRPGAIAPHAAVPACLFQPKVESLRIESVAITRLTLAVRLDRLDGKRMLLAPDGTDLLTSPIAAGRPTPRPHLVRALAQAHAWRDALLTPSVTSHAARGTSARGANRAESSDRAAAPTIADIARAAGVTAPRITLLLPLAHLSPRITAAVLTGNLAPRITLQDLLEAAAHPDWDRQAASLGLDAQR